MVVHIAHRALSFFKIIVAVVSVVVCCGLFFYHREAYHHSVASFLRLHSLRSGHHHVLSYDHVVGNAHHIIMYRHLHRID